MKSAEKHCDPKNSENRLRKEALQTTKEIVVKFIETQRVSPSNFEDVFPAVYRVVCRAIAETPPPPNED